MEETNCKPCSETIEGKKYTACRACPLHCTGSISTGLSITMEDDPTVRRTPIKVMDCVTLRYNI